MISSVLRFCSSCKLEKPFSDFYETKRDGFQRKCKECFKLINRNYWLNKSKDPEFMEIHRSKSRQDAKSERGKKRRADYERTPGGKANRRKAVNKHAQTVKGKLPRVLRSRLYGAVKDNYKTGSAVRDLQCTIPEFKSYIEVFWHDAPDGTPMSWGKWGSGPGKWQIDHIKPLADFDLTQRDQLLQAVCFINQQPLWYEEHLEKSAEESRQR